MHDVEVEWSKDMPLTSFCVDTSWSGCACATYLLELVCPSEPPAICPMFQYMPSHQEASRIEHQHVCLDSLEHNWSESTMVLKMLEGGGRQA
eukprot:5513001-Amphidinium_carterae.2